MRPTENTQAARQARFTKSADIVKNQSTLKTYIREAMEVEKAGLEVPYKDISEHKVPKEFQDKLDKNSKLKAAFKALTPGRQRAYLLHFSSAKQSKTRESRIEKCAPQILAGKGLDD
nr:YdeI/OmpD-associated family protein [Verrucomicrobium spinosum]